MRRVFACNSSSGSGLVDPLFELGRLAGDKSIEKLFGVITFDEQVSVDRLDETLCHGVVE